MNNNVGGQLSKLIEITKEIENFLKPHNSFFLSNEERRMQLMNKSRVNNGQI